MAELKKDLLTRIVVDPNIMVGKPVIKGTRLTVQQVLLLLAQGISFDGIVAEYPVLTSDDISACVLFATEALEHSSFTPLYQAS